MRSLSFLLASTLLAVTPLGAQSGRIPYDTFSLANGLKVIYSEDHSAPIVSVNVWYDVGSRNERPGRSGFAHLFEHMMFQGSAHVRKAEHFQFVMRAGGTLNGTTSEDRTNYYETLPSNRLNLALWLEADRMRSLAITQENFENQRETVKEERRLGVDNRPYSRAFIDGLTVPFDSTRCFAYAHTVIGSMDDLNAAKLEDVQAFFDLYYAPNNATLVVVGDFAPAELRRLAQEYFGDIRRQEEPPPVTCDARFGPGLERRELADPLANLPATIRFYRVPPHDDSDTPALSLLSSILGEGESSRLNVGVVRRARAAVAAGAFSTGARRGPGTIAVYGIANQGVEVAHLDSIVALQLDSIRAAGVTTEELTKAKNSYRAGFIDARETTFDKAEQLQHYAMFHGSLADIDQELDRVLAVTPDDVKRVASRYFDPANAVVMIVKAGGGQ